MRKNDTAVVTYLETPGSRPNRNQRVLHYADRWEFWSYNSLIVKITLDGTVMLYPEWNASGTTNRYRKQFLGEGLSETRRKARAGTYLLAPGADPSGERFTHEEWTQSSAQGHENEGAGHGI